MLRYLLGCCAIVLLLSCNEKPSGKATPAADTTTPATSQTGAPVPEDVTTGPDGLTIATGSLPKSIAAAIPAGYSVLDTSAGDLNLDAYPDMIVVLKKDGEESTQNDVEDPVKRPLLVMTGAADGSYSLAARNDNTVYCARCGGVMGDPYTGVTINNGYFSAEHYGGSSWRWSRIVTFKYSPSEKIWLLHKDGGEHFNTNEPEKITEKVHTVKDFGKVPFESFDIYAEEESGE